MALIKTKKRKKESRMHGRKMGTHSGGCRKNRKGSGHRGGIGLAGSGKRGDQKKTLITKKYGGSYFGKKGITSRKTAKDTRLRINLQEIELNLEKYGKKKGEKYEIDLSKYKILGKGDVKNKLIIKAFEASNSAIDKVKAVGGEIIIKEKKKIETPLVESPKTIEKKKKATQKK